MALESGEVPEEPEQCATPTVEYAEGKLQFKSETPGAEFYYTLSAPDTKTTATWSEGTVDLAACYEIECYAMAEGYLRSKNTKAQLYWLRPADKENNITDIAHSGIVVHTDGGYITIPSRKVATLLHVIKHKVYNCLRVRNKFLECRNQFVTLPETRVFRKIISSKELASYRFLEPFKLCITVGYKIKLKPAICLFARIIQLQHDIHNLLLRKRKQVFLQFRF